MGSDIDNAKVGSEIPLAFAPGRSRAETVNALLELGAIPTPQVEGVTVFPFARAAKEEKHYAAADILQNAMDLPGLISSGKPNDDNHKIPLLVGSARGASTNTKHRASLVRPWG